MQKKTLLSACIALALSGSGWAADIDDTDSATRQRKETRIPCPTAHSSEKLSPQQLKSLPSECSTTNDNNLYSLIAVGATSLITTLAVLELNHDDGNHAHSSDNPPVPPDDDNGGNTPDDGGDVPPPKEPKIFNNNVTFDEDKGTLKIRNATFTYSKNTDGTYTLTAGDGRTTVVQGWDVDTAANTVEITGVNTQGGMTWRYGKDGIIYITKTVGATVDDPASSHVFNLSDAVLTDQGGNAALNGATVIEINGSRIVLNNDGDISATGKDSVVVAMTGNDITVNNNGHMVVDGGTAGVVNGDRAILNNRGDAVITNGGAGVIVTGDNAVINNTGQSDIDGDNSVSVKVAGNATRIKMEGGLNVSGGAHGIDATGDNNEVSNKGNISVVDAHSTGVLLNGDRASFINMGDINVSGGAADDHAIGVQINGDNSTFINVGDLNADDRATGVKITGDASDIALAGAMHVGDFASGLEVTGKNNDLSLSTNMMDVTGKQSTGVTITGDDNTIDITGDMVVDQNSVGTKIVGDRVSLQQKGDITVNGAGHGVEVSGSKATINNQGKLTVKDQDSIGIAITGDDAQFTTVGEIDVSLNGTGVAISGDREQVNLSGDINVIQARDGSGTFQGGTGISIMGNDSSMLLAGNINLTSSMGDQPSTSPLSLTGVTIGGENNTVDLEGDINIIVDSDYLGDENSLYGVVVSGSNNIINLNGGINISGDSGGHAIKGVQVTGNNSVNISGHSVMNTRQVLGAFSLISVADGGNVVFDENAITEIQSSVRNTIYYYESSLIVATGNQSVIQNKGIINTTDAQELMMADSGAQVVNAGVINIRPDAESHSFFAGMMARGDDSQAKNVSGGTINLTSITRPFANAGFNEYPVKWYSNTGYALLASNYGSVINEAGATVNLHGAGTYGVSASKGTATNAGEINVDGFVPTIDENGNIIDETYWQPSFAFLMGGGMLAGSTDADGDAKAVNTGTINVKNEGFGMLALKGGTAVNQGVINLTADAGVTKEQNNQLFGMGAYGDGVAINDKTGVINIDTDVGQAFYSDGTGTIINYGTICTFGVCQNPNEYNPTDQFVSLPYSGGDILVADGASTNFSNPVLITDATSGTTVNEGTASGNTILVQSGVLENTSTGIINNLIQLEPDAVINNAGTMGNIDAQGGTLNNDGANTNVVNNTGTIKSVVQKSGVLNNSGTVTSRITQDNGTFNNLEGGTVQNGSRMTSNSVVNNDGTWILGSSSSGNNAGMLEINNNSVFNNRGEFTLDNSKNAVHINNSGTLYNTGHMSLTASSHNGAVNIWGGNGRFINDGVIDATAKAVAVSASDAGSSDAFFWNQENGVINFDHDSASAVKFTHNNFVAQNDGTMNISGNKAVAMEGNKNAQLVNNGTINLGTEGTTDTGMVGMQLDTNATADAVIENNGTINIFANDSFAFSVLGTEGHVVNNGTVVIADGVTGSGLIKQGDSVNVEGVNGNNGNNTEVHYGDYTLPDVPNTATVSVTSDDSSAGSGMNNLNGYVVGTNVDGSAGTLMVNNASMNGVGINTGFAAGTADTTVTFDNVVKGSNLTDADAITSTSVVWKATGSTDASGNVDVTMSKNAYTDVATDASVNDVAKALDAGYTNNELYTSLNVCTTAELNSALKQVSGSQATTVFREARVLSNRFSMLADAAPKVGNGLAFNVVAKGDPRAELGNNTEYDMLALRKTLDLSESQTMSLEYGIARLDGDGAQKAGDNGVTGGYSQFFGLKHQMSFDNGISWNNALRYDIHQLDSSRSVAYGDVSKTADTNVKQQYLEFRSEGAKTFEPREGLKITPYAGVKLRHTLEGGYQERNAGDFNLSMNSGSETAVDSIVGLKLDYAGKEGWSANATLEGGPNLSYNKSQRTASLAGAGSQHFNVDDGQKGGGINSLASVGVKYSSKESSLNLDAYHWKEDGISDKGVMLNFKETF
ncbi:autotransporter outer membrane beta-barrel domain-containing protein [Escherichia albertii]|nr:autotransporter outer membrane beta-barrel domain-containing protein [Escherichia albertii]MCZ9197419.1 autotransporter outer membrane beta-barrel domain-containing protein [Escherichia albertii]MCZ9216056.1 autotransporter outer membrane beta-barrel domain-containing protein [Escherichia albertii]MCZ9225373.1 autotransporter outer membrane beta-barrel domain-containing protein [Escherichia albertii]